MSRFPTSFLLSLVVAIVVLHAASVTADESPTTIWNELPAVEHGRTSYDSRGTMIPSQEAAGAGLHPSWPVNLSAPGSGFPYVPTLFDADGDGADEIFLTGGHTFGLRGDGTFLPGWPTTEMLYMGYGTNGSKPGPSVADLEGDGDNEILWTERDWWAGSSYMWCMNGKEFDGSDMPGMPQAAPDQSSNALDTPFVLGDTDGDGNLEAWAAHTLGNTGVHYRISAFDHLGNRLFTVDLNSDENVLSLYFGDVDGSGTDEMFAISFRDPSLWLHVFAPDGSEQPGYPVVAQTFSSGYLPFGPPVPFDLDDDGDLEILMGHWGGGSRVYCCHHDGTPCAGFPLQIASSSQLFYVGLGDVAGDDAPELIAYDNHLGSGYRVHVLDLATGAVLPGWPYPLTYWPKSFPTVADVDNDGVQDICVATDGGELLALSGTGQMLPGYPQQMISPSISGVGVGDIDADGLFELVTATWDGWVYAWDTTGEALPERADWPMRGIDARNTGIFGEPGGTSAVSGTPSPARRRGLRVTPNPVIASAQFEIDAALPSALIHIYDPSGRLVEVVRAHGDAPVAWQPGAARPAGVYFARLQGTAGTAAVRFVVLR